MKILEYYSPVTPFTIYIIGDWFSLTFKSHVYILPYYISQGYRAIRIEKFLEDAELLCDELRIDKDSFISYTLSAYEENKQTYPNEANNIDITLLTERQIDLVAVQTTNIKMIKRLFKHKKDLSFYGLMRNPNTPSKMISNLIKCSEWCADCLISRKYPFNEQHLDIIAKKYPDLLTKWLAIIDADQTLIERHLSYVNSEKIYRYMISNKIPQYFHEYAITQDNELEVWNVMSASPDIHFIIKCLERIYRDKE